MLSELLHSLSASPREGFSQQASWPFPGRNAAPSSPCQLAGGPSAKVKLDSGISLALCLQTEAGGSGCRGSLPRALWGQLTGVCCECPEGKKCPGAALLLYRAREWAELADCTRDLPAFTHASRYKGFSFQLLQLSGEKKKKKEHLRKDKCRCLFQEKDLWYHLQWRKYQINWSAFLVFFAFWKGKSHFCSYYFPFLQILQEMLGKLLLTWAITLKCLDRTSYCLEHICIHSQCKCPWKALCRSHAFWAFPVVPVFQSKPIQDEFGAFSGMWIPSYIHVSMSLKVNMSLSFHHCFCRDQLPTTCAPTSGSAALTPGTWDRSETGLFDPKECQAAPKLTSCQLTVTEMQELYSTFLNPVRSLSIP